MTDKKTWSLADPPEEPQTRGDATPLLVSKPLDPAGNAFDDGGHRAGPELADRQPVLMGNPKGSRYATGPSIFGQDEDELERRGRRKIFAAVLLVALALVALAAFVWLRRG
ncbi:hypothetical protein [Polyangium sp. 6x1]|uniref:hypothetical protein n=1 Tax=Polyangium sp. 6x1 TaxID=3042689 RepID=UPI0024830E3D|nr:hypothetical protein [Polyangium sp. 6x1]MDI1451616.1 hypothetical protein [Polyangium sp. 6x1]